MPRSPAAARAAGSGGLGPLFYLLLAYALLMTGLAVYGFVFRYGSQIEPGHPLSTIPDNFGEFPPAERKKQGKLKELIDTPIPAELRVGIGRKIDVGQLEIEPVKVEVRDLKVIRVGRTGKERTDPQDVGRAVVMTLRLRNTSDDVTFHPMDPALTRKYLGNSDEPKPGTALVVGDKMFFGGAIDWPVRAHNVGREFEVAQEADETPLKPRETREYVVFTAADKQIVTAVESAQQPMLWRVHLRRGLFTMKGKDVPVTAIIGVEFRATDVQKQ